MKIAIVFLAVAALSAVGNCQEDTEEDLEFIQQNDESDKDEYTAEENLGNSKVIEGDIMLDKSTQAIMDSLKSDARDAIRNPVKHWPNGVIPYRFGSVSSNVRRAVHLAIADYNKYTCIKLVRRTSQRDYLEIVSKGGCWSMIGRSGGRQELSLGRGCEHKGTAIHEIMHAIGFFHEQSRLDRDEYITIKWGNINSGMRYNFNKYRHGEAVYHGQPYDYYSVMHYPKHAFSINGQATIVPRRQGITIGNRSGFSKIDIRQINAMYKCGGVRPTQPRPTQRTNPPTQPTGSCRDGHSKCGTWASRGYCRRQYVNYMKKNCKKSCGLCGGSSCTDKKWSCRRWASRYCNSWRYKTFMRKNCKKSCRLC